MEYLIWSNQHNSWWCANGRGYCSSVHNAGVYTEEQAIEICNNANFDWNVDLVKKIPNELPIPKYIAVQLHYRNGHSSEDFNTTSLTKK